MNDTIEVDGLAEVLDEEEDPPYLELAMRCNGRVFRATILAAEGEWTLNVRDASGRSCPGSGEMYTTQADSIVAAMLIALQSSRQLPLM